MKYENARDLLPEALLRQVQKYISGKVVYIPAREKKREWGTASGYREYLRERNREICGLFSAGESIGTLARQFHLSEESIKRIVYSRKEICRMEYRNALSSAREWAEKGRLEEWVHAYLLSDGHNKPFSDGLKIVDRLFLGPVKMPLHLFSRCTVPDIPPLIVHYLIPEGSTEGEFELNDGNTRFEAYRRLGVEEAWVIVWITDGDEREQFMARYGQYFPAEE